MASSLKTRNMIIAGAVTLALLGWMVLSVWKDTVVKDGEKGAGDSGGRRGSVADFSSNFQVKAVLSGAVPADISQAAMPSLILHINNRFTRPVILKRDKLRLRKYDYIKRDENRAAVCATYEVNPHEIHQTKGSVERLVLASGETTSLEFEIGDLFTFYPGVFDVAAVLLPGGITNEQGGLANLREIKALARVEVAKGASQARAFYTAEGFSLNEESARVNGESISAEEFNQKLTVIYGHTLLQKLIAERLVWQTMKSNDVKVTPADLDYAIAYEERSLKDRLKGVPFSTYLESIGTSEDKLRRSKGFIMRVAIRKYLMSRRGQAPGVQELMSFFDRHYGWYGREEMIRARKLVVAPEDPARLMARENALDKLLAIKREIKSGKVTFEEAVELYSQDVRARVSGGQLEPFRSYSETRENDVPRATAEAGFRLKPGEISTPINTGEEGYMILQVIERIPPIKVLFKDVRAQVTRDLIYEQVSGEQIQTWIQELFRDSEIGISPRLLKQFQQREKLSEMIHYEHELVKEEE